MDYEFILLGSISIYVCEKGGERVASVKVWSFTEPDSLQTPDKWGKEHKIHTDTNIGSARKHLSP